MRSIRRQSPTPPGMASGQQNQNRPTCRSTIWSFIWRKLRPNPLIRLPFSLPTSGRWLTIHLLHLRMVYRIPIYLDHGIEPHQCRCCGRGSSVHRLRSRGDGEVPDRGAVSFSPSPSQLDASEGAVSEKLLYSRYALLGRCRPARPSSSWPRSLTRPYNAAVGTFNSRFFVTVDHSPPSSA